eukprot:2399-Heterococcus_DN1.PRE.2
MSATTRFFLLHMNHGAQRYPVKKLVRVADRSVACYNALKVLSASIYWRTPEKRSWRKASISEEELVELPISPTPSRKRSLPPPSPALSASRRGSSAQPSPTPLRRSSRRSNSIASESSEADVPFHAQPQIETIPEDAGTAERPDEQQEDLNVDEEEEEEEEFDIDALVDIALKASRTVVERPPPTASAAPAARPTQRTTLQSAHAASAPPHTSSSCNNKMMFKQLHSLNSGLTAPAYIKYSTKGKNKGAQLQLGGQQTAAAKAKQQRSGVRSSSSSSSTAAANAGTAESTYGQNSALYSTAPGQAVPPLRKVHANKDQSAVAGGGKSAGNGWFNVVGSEQTAELKRDAELIRMRGYMDPKRFYKAPEVCTARACSRESSI